MVTARKDRIESWIGSYGEIIKKKDAEIIELGKENRDMRKTLEKIAWLNGEIDELKGLSKKDLWMQLLQDTEQARACLKRNAR